MGKPLSQSQINLKEVFSMATDQLNELIARNPFYIPIPEAAAFLHISPESLRASIDQNRCPFGFSWQIGERSGYKIPTLAFVSWLTKGTFTPAA